MNEYVGYGSGDWRNEENVKLARLRDQKELEKTIRKNGAFQAFVEKKLNGERCTIQFGNGSLFVVSRGKKNAAHGSEASKENPYIYMDVPDWLEPLRNVVGQYVVDCEKVVLTGESSNSLVNRLDVDYKFIAFDILVCQGTDYRKELISVRKYHLNILDDMFFGLIKEGRLSRNPVIDVIVTLEMFDFFKSNAKELKIEGYVIKPVDWPYGSTIGYKLKPVEDSLDGVIVDCKVSKKHHLGTVTKTDDIGVLVVKQHVFENGVDLGWLITAHVSGQPGFKISEKDKLIGRVIEFHSFGWDAAVKRWSFPALDRLRNESEKNPDECTLNV